MQYYNFFAELIFFGTKNKVNKKKSKKYLLIFIQNLYIEFYYNSNLIIIKKNYNLGKDKKLNKI